MPRGKSNRSPNVPTKVIVVDKRQNTPPGKSAGLGLFGQTASIAGGAALGSALGSAAGSAFLGRHSYYYTKEEQQASQNQNINSQQQPCQQLLDALLSCIERKGTINYCEELNRAYIECKKNTGS